MLRRRVLAAIIIVIVLSSILAVWTVKERIWEKPKIERTIVVLADSEDYSSASKLIDYLKGTGSQVVRITRSDLDKYKSCKLAFVLGGPYSREGIYEVIKEVLTGEERRNVEVPGRRAAYLKEDVWSKGQQVVFYVGSDRSQTKEAWLQTFSPPKVDLSEISSKVYAFPLVESNTSSVKATGSTRLSSGNPHLAGSDDHECTPPSLYPRIKFGTGKVTDANGELPFDNFQDYVDVEVFNPVALTQNYKAFLANPKQWFIDHLREWATDQVDSIYRIEITCDCGATTYTVDLKELGNCFHEIDMSLRLEEYRDLIQGKRCPICGSQFRFRWPAVSLEGMLDNLRTELMGTGDFEDFLKNFAGLDEEYNEFPWGIPIGILKWTVPCASSGITPQPIVLVVPRCVGFFSEYKALHDFINNPLWDYTVYPPWTLKLASEGALTRHVANWRINWCLWNRPALSSGWCWNATVKQTGTAMQDEFSYYIQHMLVTYSEPQFRAEWGSWPIDISGVGVGVTWYRWCHNAIPILSVPLEVTFQGEVFDFEGWLIDGTTRKNNTAIAVWMDRPHEVIAKFAKRSDQTRPPYITDYWPPGVTGDVPVDTRVWFVFSKPMDHASTENAFSINPYVAGSFSWIDDWLLFFIPANNLAFSTTYTVTIGASATDQQGNALDLSMSVGNPNIFTTQAGPNLKLYTTVPIMPGARPTAKVGMDLPIVAIAKHYDDSPAERVDVSFDKTGVIGDFDHYPSTARTNKDGEAMITWIAGSVPGTATITASATIDNIPVQASLDITVTYGAWRLLQNTGFEDWVGEVIPRYWARDSEAEGLLCISTDSHSGRYSVELGGIMIISQIVEAQPNRFTDFGFWMKLLIHGPTPLQVNTELQWLDSSYNIINVQRFPANPDGTWRRYAIDTTWPGPFISPANTAYAKIVFKAELGEREETTILIDDVFFGQAIPLPPLSVDVWTNKGGQGLNMPDGSYYIGETVVISFSINVNATVRLTVIKPDGTTLTYGPESLAAGVYTITAGAGYPPGQRTVILEAWVGDQHASDTVVFTVLEGE